MPSLNAPCTLVVMAKPPVPGRVKTRLMPRLTAQQAADAHEAMLDCVLDRLAALPAADRVLAADAPDDPVWAPVAARHPAWRRVPQGAGGLGERLDTVWRALGGGAVAFFGVDSPDAPADALAAIAPALADHDAAVGPVADGGYWTLAANRHRPELLTGIDWGTPAVYDQTLQAARSALIRLAPLRAWHDVDAFEDLTALRRRLAPATEPPLRRLHRRLQTLLRDHG